MFQHHHLPSILTNPKLASYVRPDGTVMVEVAAYEFVGVYEIRTTKSKPAPRPRTAAELFNLLKS